MVTAPRMSGSTAFTVGGGTRVFGEACTRDHFRGRLFHRRHRFVGVGLNRLDQRFDSLGRARSAFGESLHFVGDVYEIAVLAKASARYRTLVL